MKKIYYIVELLIFIIIINPFSCSVNLTTTWTVSGTRIFNGTPPAGTPIKLAGFFENYDYQNPVIVNNVVNVTHVAHFHLDIDASSLDPDDYDKIELKMWEDDNNNDSEDSDERSYITEPAPGGCPVFGEASDYFGDYCEFVWHDEKSGCIVTQYKGWNVKGKYSQSDSSCSSESIDTAVLTGASITNRNSF